MWPNPHFTADLVTFTEEISNEKTFFFVKWLQNPDTAYNLTFDFINEYHIAAWHLSRKDFYTFFQSWSWDVYYFQASDEDDKDVGIISSTTQKVKF